MDGRGKVNYAAIETGLNGFEINATWLRRELSRKIGAYVQERIKLIDRE